MFNESKTQSLERDDKGRFVKGRFVKGQIPWNKGIPMTSEQKKKISLALIGKVNSGKFRKGHVGYHYWEGKHFKGEHIRKLSESHKGQKVWNKGKRCPQISKTLMGHSVTEETRRKISVTKIGNHASPKTEFKNGEKGYWLGRYRSKETKDKIRQSNLGKLRSRETKNKMSLIRKNRYRTDSKFAKMMMRSIHLKPNKKEQQLDLILNSICQNTFKYVGDGQIIIDGLCPDFIDCNGKKQIIELFGDAFHNPLKTFRDHIPYRQTEKGRIEAFAKYGYSTLIIWEHELKQPEILKEKIMDFVGINNEKK